MNLTNNYMRNLNKILKYFRTFGHYNQKDIAQLLRISRSYVSEIESGKKEPSMDVIQRYSEFFEISVSGIFLFAEELGDKKILKKKAKGMLSERGAVWLNWICKDKTFNAEEK